MIVLPDWLPPDRPWPVDLKSYNRRAKLSASEKVALRLYVRLLIHVRLPPVPASQGLRPDNQPAWRRGRVFGLR